MSKCGIFLAVVLVCTVVTTAQAELVDNCIELCAEKYFYTGPGNDGGFGYEGGIYVEIEELNDPSRTLEGVSLRSTGETSYDAMTLNGNEYESESDEDQNFDDLGVNGNWYIDVITSNGGTTYHSVYAWSISGITRDSWNDVPAITSHNEGDTETNLRPDFTWAVGSVDSEAELFVELYQPPGVDDEVILPNTQLAWTPGYDLALGDVEFLVGYSIIQDITVSYDATESAALGNAGGDVVSWLDTEAWLDATDDVMINIVPEPATMTLLGLGALALIRIRKRKS